MKPGIVKKLSAVLVLCSLLLLFTGCGSLKEGQAILDDQLEQMIACITANDKAAAGDLSYDEQFRQEFSGIFDELAAYWPAKTGDAYALQSIDISITNQRKLCQGTYLVHSGGQDYTVNLTHLEDEGGSGITSFHVALSSELAAATTPTGTMQTAASNTPLQWAFLVFWLAAFGFCLFTIVDIIRKRPRHYGLWIVVAVLCLSLTLRISEWNVSMHVTVGIVSASQWLQYPDGVNAISIGLPAGAIVYRCMRNKLLRKKSSQLNAPVSQVFAVPLEPTPAEPQPEHTEETIE